ncbi:MBL fold metallo-hydrolase [Pelagibaculum spongiae]|uniref:Metallo-beta-lactamase domain-containing protein n=1 Tax=Pelagibaculum spongiae TaxID=2080658 RepID=A0A2V1H1T1_9GAMM|nr:MBL fold metallo-hydrolase [Pelagibaculum spongiae]PVZ70392.1 hypothetical protein DC094_07305 [Pelagibaculum spongiae]
MLRSLVKETFNSSAQLPRPILSGILLTAILITGCASQVSHLPILKNSPKHAKVLARANVNAPTEQASSKLQVQYLGVSGFKLSYNGSSILTAPSFSNPAFWGFPPAPFMAFQPDTQRIDRLMQQVDAQQASMILVGHAHYDHLMDVPYIANQFADKAMIIGSKTTKHSIASQVSSQRIIPVNKIAAKDDQPGQWIYSQDKKVRVMAIESEHAPHILGIKFLQGSYQKDLPQLPKTIGGWVEGKTYAYLIDFLENNGEIAYRVHFQDAASTPPLGFVPNLPQSQQKRVDAAIHCVAAYDQVDDYPNLLVQKMQPKISILAHWEDFFGNQPDGEQQGVRLTSIEGFIGELESVQAKDAKWIMPKPMVTFEVE